MTTTSSSRFKSDVSASNAPHPPTGPQHTHMHTYMRTTHISNFTHACIQVLDDDNIFLPLQERRVAVDGGWRKSYVLPTAADTYVSAYRRWQPYLHTTNLQPSYIPTYLHACIRTSIQSFGATRTCFPTRRTLTSAHTEGDFFYILHTHLHANIHTVKIRLEKIVHSSHFAGYLCERLPPVTI